MLAKLVKDVNNKVASSYLLKLQKYDKEIEKKKKPIEKEKTPKLDRLPKLNTSEPKNVVIMNDANYRVENLLKEAKKIDEKFDIDNSETIKKFIRENVKDNNTTIYNKLIEFKNNLNKFDEDYLVSTYQKGKVLKITPPEVRDIIEEYFIGTDEITLTDLMERLELEIKKNDPIIYVYTGSKKKNYNYIDKRIKTIYDESIYKGIKIYYHNKLYDFSVE